MGPNLLHACGAEPMCGLQCERQAYNSLQQILAVRFRSSEMSLYCRSFQKRPISTLKRRLCVASFRNYSASQSQAKFRPNLSGFLPC